MPFIPHTDDDVKSILSTIGVDSIEKLFAEIPADLRKVDLSTIPAGVNEMTLTREMQVRAKLNDEFLSFLGAGAYRHHIPGAVWEIAMRGEFMTAYTPYQAEASQGLLQLMYEYQTMMASLLSMNISNASLYDGASALAEAILMGLRLIRDITAPILLPQTVHPHYRQVIATIVGKKNIIDIPYDKKTGRIDFHFLQKYSTQNGMLIIPQPNFFGVLEEVDNLTDWAKTNNHLVIAVVNPLAMALLKPPGQWGETGADIACGEGQPLGVPLACGGPYYGFMACKEDKVRQMPGRIVGRTVDAEGKPGFVLTLQAREQHIRRAKATSNICTNQGLMIAASTIYMSLLGPQGLRQVAAVCHQQAQYLQKLLCEIPDVKIMFSSPFFHEFVIQLPQSAEKILHALAQKKIQAGWNLQSFYPDLGECLLVCATEMTTHEDAEQLAQALRKII